MMNRTLRSRLGRRLLCWSVQNLLDLHADDRLSPAWTARVEAHLEACGRCRGLALDAGSLRALFKDLPPVQTPPGLTDAILKGIREEASAELGARGVPWRLEPARAFALVYLALLAAGNAKGTPSQGRGPGTDWNVELPQ